VAEDLVSSTKLSTAETKEIPMAAPVDRRHKTPGNLNDGLPLPHHDHDHNHRPRPVAPDRAPLAQGGWQGKPNPDGSYTAKPAAAQPSNAAPGSNDAQLATLRSEHEIQNKFQLDLLDLQQDFAADQFWVTTLSAINKSADETRKELGRKF